MFRQKSCEEALQHTFKASVQKVTVFCVPTRILDFGEGESYWLSWVEPSKMQQCFFGFSSAEATFMSFLLTFVFKFFFYFILQYTLTILW